MVYHHLVTSWMCKHPFCTGQSSRGWARANAMSSKVDTVQEAHQHAPSNQHRGVQNKAEQQCAVQRHSMPWQWLRSTITFLRQGTMAGAEVPHIRSTMD